MDAVEEKVEKTIPDVGQEVLVHKTVYGRMPERLDKDGKVIPFSKREVHQPNYLEIPDQTLDGLTDQEKMLFCMDLAGKMLASQGITDGGSARYLGTDFVSRTGGQ